MLAFQLSGSILLQPVRATAFMTVFGDKTQRDGAKRNRAEQAQNEERSLSEMERSGIELNALGLKLRSGVPASRAEGNDVRQDL